MSNNVSFLDIINYNDSFSYDITHSFLNIPFAQCRVIESADVETGWKYLKKNEVGKWLRVEISGSLLPFNLFSFYYTRQNIATALKQHRATLSFLLRDID